MVIQWTTVTWLLRYIKLVERQRIGLEFTRKFRQQASPKLLQLFTKILYPISQSFWTSKFFFSHFQSISSPDPRTDFVCFSVVTDGRADKRILILWIEISEKILEILVETFSVLCSWFPSPLSHKTLLPLTPILCISPFLPLGSYFLLPVFLVHRGVISLNSSAAILQLSLIPFRAGSFPCLRH